MSNRIELALSGQAIRLQSLKVSVSMKLQDKDQSGQASSTATSEQGTKGKELKISGLLPFTELDELTLIYSLAEAQRADGSKVRYRVNHEIARAIKFREATFSGEVGAVEESELMAWRVSFTLKEYFSTAERKAAAGAGTGAPAQVQTSQGTSAAAETPEQLSRFERILQGINDRIGPAGGGN